MIRAGQPWNIGISALHGKPYLTALSRCTPLVPQRVLIAYLWMILCMSEGNLKGYLLQNTLFRVGGAAMLMSSRWQAGTFLLQLETTDLLWCRMVSEPSIDWCTLFGVRTMQTTAIKSGGFF